jgi:acyl-CoA reductase-like NAD-dependent aldehyde dehydrogenase
MSTTTARVVQRHGLRIGGSSRGSSDESAFTVVDPATGAELAEVSSATAIDARTAVDAADAGAGFEPATFGL